MFKHANSGALPAMLVLGVLIGASLAVASPSRPNGAVPSASPSVVAGPGVPSDDGGGRENPHASPLVNALNNGPGSGGKLGRESAHPGVAAESGGSDWTSSGVSGGSDGSGGSGGSGSTGGGKDNNGKAKGHHDGKGNNG
ncbi:MAG TPA: hypothetical protein VEN95_06630 [Actinomycetota bacterium]|jgi:hypothetical protein|nr:hypothetical protein [Actinomycetota bacterium]